MTLPSPGGPRRPRLRSSKSLFEKSSSYEVSGKISSSYEERSTTGILSDGAPCSKTGEQWQREETSGGDPGGGDDPDGADGGVETLLGEEDPSLEGERGLLVPLLSSTMFKRIMREENPKRKVKNCKMTISTRWSYI
jgi:hypothetical protein